MNHEFDKKCILFLGILFFVAGGWSVAAAVDGPDGVLTNAAMVRALTADEAARGLPVKLTGVVVMKHYENALTLLDETASVWMDGATNLFAGIGRCDLVCVEGCTERGNFAPAVSVQVVQKLGHGALPAPRHVTFDELRTGKLHAQLVEVSGVVRWVQQSGPTNSVWALRLATGGGSLAVRVSEAQAMVLPVDSEVRLRGICLCQFNKARQVLNPTMRVHPGDSVEVLIPAPSDPYAVPAQSISSLMQFNMGISYDHRVRVRGVVIHSEPGGDFWIRDENGGLRIKWEYKDSPVVGTEVDVLGFVNRGEYSPVLEDAEFRKIGTVQLPQPVRLKSAALVVDHDADLVELNAVIMDQWVVPEGYRLQLSNGKIRFQALLRTSGAESVSREWLSGSRVRVAGICSVSMNAPGFIPGALIPKSFEILLRSPADMTILRPPSWWTAAHIRLVMGLVVGVLLLVIAGIVWNSRRRLRAQAVARAQSEAEFAAVWNERNRMARELHDTLAQGLTAISMQLEVAKRRLPADSPVRAELDEARALARSSLAETRSSIWNMKSQVLENGDLVTALDGIIKSMPDCDGVEGSVRVIGEARRLASVVENNLLRMGQESIANAFKHARAKRIEVVLEFRGGQVSLSVKDNGQGFDTANPPRSEGGFGLAGMRERVAQLNGEFKVTSERGKGTVVTAVVAG